MHAYQEDIDIILSHRFDLGADFWMDEQKKVCKNAPFTTLDCISFLVELGLEQNHEVFQNVIEVLFTLQRKDGRFQDSIKGSSYPCHSARIWLALCQLRHANDTRLIKTRQYFLNTQEADGGWKCNKYSFGRGLETAYSTPLTTLFALDAFRYLEHEDHVDQLDQAVDFLLRHWTLKKPISPCHYGIGTLFMQVEYPFRGYTLFYYVYVLSFYESARKDPRFLEAYTALCSHVKDERLIVERVVPKLAKLSFCEKGKPSVLATKRLEEITKRLS